MPLIAAIDQGTTSTRVMIFNEDTHVLAMAQRPVKSICPQPGWTEQNPLEIIDGIHACLEEVAALLIQQGFSMEDIKSIGIANQRETTVAWNANTGAPLYNAIVWMDTRTISTVERLKKQLGSEQVQALQDICGLPLSTYFSALKMRWMLDNVPSVKKAAAEGSLKFGTVDSWILWNLAGKIYLTDVTNASRTMLLDLKFARWDQTLLDIFGIELGWLPTVQPSSGQFGAISSGAFADIPISAVLGDQHAALLGHRCLQPGQLKITYGTGCFLLMNAGSRLNIKKDGLLDTIAYQISRSDPISYAREGSIAVAGAAISWLHENLKLLDSPTSIGTFPSFRALVFPLDLAAREADDSGGVLFIPALSGLLAPYWNASVRGAFLGLTLHTTKAHMIRAVLEATAFSIKDIVNLMTKGDLKSSRIMVDGGLSLSNLLMQIQADLLQITTIRPRMSENTALGAALAAGTYVKVWPDISNVATGENDCFIPDPSKKAYYEKLHAKWKKALEKICELSDSSSQEEGDL